jgi:hypothetical protein
MTERGLAAGDGNGSDRLVESTASKSGGPDGMSSIDNSLCLSRGVGGGNIDGSACCSCGPDGMSSIGNSLCFRRGVGGGSIDDSACCTVGADDVLSFTPVASETNFSISKSAFSNLCVLRPLSKLLSSSLFVLGLGQPALQPPSIQLWGKSPILSSGPVNT